MQRNMKIIELFKKNPTTFILGLILFIIIVIIAGIVLMPSIFYDQWSWEHYWGPVVADASGAPAYRNGKRLMKAIQYSRS